MKLHKQINKQLRRSFPKLDPQDATAQVWVNQEHKDRNCGCGANDSGWYGGDEDLWNLEEGNVVCINMYYVEPDQVDDLGIHDVTIVGHAYFEIENGKAILSHII